MPKTPSGAVFSDPLHVAAGATPRLPNMLLQRQAATPQEKDTGDCNFQAFATAFALRFSYHVTHPAGSVAFGNDWSGPSWGGGNRQRKVTWHRLVQYCCSLPRL